jgi:hypothetical protein
MTQGTVTPVSAEEYLSGGAKSAAFPDRAFGTIIGGTITDEPRMMQQRDYTTSDPMFYPDSGQPMMQLVVHVQTDLRDPDDPADDGVRAIYVKGQLRQAVINAMRGTGDKVPRKGGTLRVRYDRDEPVTLKNGKPGNPQKIYAAQYLPPAARGAADFLAEDGNGNGAAQTSTTQAAPVVTQFATGPTREMGAVETVRAPAVSGRLACPAAIDPGKWAAMSDAQHAQMYAALGLNADEPPF